MLFSQICIEQDDFQTHAQTIHENNWTLVPQCWKPWGFPKIGTEKDRLHITNWLNGYFERLGEPKTFIWDQILRRETPKKSENVFLVQLVFGKNRLKCSARQKSITKLRFIFLSNWKISNLLLVSKLRSTKREVDTQTLKNNWFAELAQARSCFWSI